MKVFVDVFTNDELMSDTFKYTLDFDEVVMKVPSTYKNKDAVGNVDIGCGNAFGGGDEEGADGEPQEKVLDVAFNSNLVETSFSKKEFLVFMKGFMDKTIAYLKENGKEDRSKVFEAAFKKFLKPLAEKYDELTIYLGSSESMDGGLAISFWEDEEAPGPVFYFFKDSLKEIKC